MLCYCIINFGEFCLLTKKKNCAMNFFSHTHTHIDFIIENAPLTDDKGVFYRIPGILLSFPLSEQTTFGFRLLYKFA